MIAIKLSQLVEILSAQVINSEHNKDSQFTDVTTDTRKIVPGCLFFALTGERFDGHDFVADAVAAGAKAVVVNRPVDGVDAIQLVVDDSKVALGLLGQWVRKQVTARVVALTGSSGKTSVKEMTAAILSQCGHTLYTQGNLNNDIGVPLTLLRLTREHQFAVVELGANHIGEIAYTVNLVRPESALVNNLSAAHLEGFGSIEGVAQAKGEIFDLQPTDGVAIINLESNDIVHWQNKLVGRKIWYFATQQHEDAQFYASDIKLCTDSTHFTLHTPHGECRIALPLLGEHNVTNSVAATALAMSVGATLDAVQKGLALSKAVPGRLYPIRLNSTQTILDDTYNANVGSMTAAAHVLAQMPGRKVFVAGDMGELGKDSEQCHKQVGEVIRSLGIDNVLSVGHFSQIISQASGCGEHYSDKASLISALVDLLKTHQTITVLIKGSRSAAMEQIIEGIKEKLAC